jgi:hypothetical protein
MWIELAGLGTYRPSSHKTEHVGRARLIHIGPQAQMILEPFLKEHAADDFVFSPQEAVRELRLQRRLRQKTRPTPSELARRRMFRPKEILGDLYTRRSYAVAIARGCQGIPRSQRPERIGKARLDPEPPLVTKSASA